MAWMDKFRRDDGMRRPPRKKASDGNGWNPFARRDALPTRKKASLRERLFAAKPLAPMPMPVRKKTPPAPQNNFGHIDSPTTRVETRTSIAHLRTFISVMQLLILVMIGFVSNARFNGAAQSASALYSSLAWLPAFVQGVLLGAAVAGAYGAALYGGALKAAWAEPADQRDLIVHFVVAPLLFIGMSLVPPLVEVAPHGLSLPLAFYVAAPLLWLAYLVSGFRLLLPGRSTLEPDIRRLIATVGGLVLAAVAIWRIFERWGYPSAGIFTQTTMAIASRVSGALAHPLLLTKIEPDGTPVYQAGSFHAHIFPGCSGLEGILLTSAFLLGVVALERKHLYLRRALALIVLAAVVTFLINALRIAALFAIGDLWSADVATNGFHANFGVVTFVAVSAAFSVAIGRFANKRAPAEPVPISAARALPLERPEIRLAYPQMAIMASALLCGLMVGKFNWFYPLPIMLGAVALHKLALPNVEDEWRVTWQPMLAGLVTYFLWTKLIPADPGASVKFAETLFSAPVLVATGWLMVRIVGSIIIAPVAEELAFRGFLIPWLSDLLSKWITRAPARTIAMTISAIGFGMLHSHILAGIIAGFVFGGIYLRKGSTRDAILAHGATNFLLSLYAVGGSHWSYL